MLYFEKEGRGESVVFIHGFMENRRIWNEFVSLFSNKFQVITIDLPGHGKSKNHQQINSMEDFAEDIIEVLNHLSISNATFIGHSMGGYVILALAEMYPNHINKAIFINSTTLADSEEKKEQRLKVIPTVHRNFQLFVKLSIPMLFSETLKPHLKEEMSLLKEIALETSIDGIEAALKGMRIRPDRSFILYDVDFPILIINGKDDKTIDVNLFETIIPEKDTIKIETLNCGHVAFMEQKTEVERLLIDFIK